MMLFNVIIDELLQGFEVFLMSFGLSVAMFVKRVTASLARE